MCFVPARLPPTQSVVLSGHINNAAWIVAMAIQGLKKSLHISPPLLSFRPQFRPQFCPQFAVFRTIFLSKSVDFRPVFAAVVMYG